MRLVENGTQGGHLFLIDLIVGESQVSHLERLSNNDVCDEGEILPTNKTRQRREKPRVSPEL